MTAILHSSLRTAGFSNLTVHKLVTKNAILDPFSEPNLGFDTSLRYALHPRKLGRLVPVLRVTCLIDRNGTVVSRCIRPLCTLGYMLAGAYNCGKGVDQGLSSNFGVDKMQPRVIRPSQSVSAWLVGPDVNAMRLMDSTGLFRTMYNRWMIIIKQN
jgi:hypothetical protein